MLHVCEMMLAVVQPVNLYFLSLKPIQSISSLLCGSGIWKHCLFPAGLESEWWIGSKSQVEPWSKGGEVGGNVLTGVGEAQRRAVKCHRALGACWSTESHSRTKGEKRNKSLSKHRLFGRAVVLLTGPWKTEENTSVSASKLQNWECSKCVLHLSFIQNYEKIICTALCVETIAKDWDCF